MGRMCWRWHILFQFQSFARVTFFCADLSTFYRILSSPSCFPWPSWSAPPSAEWLRHQAVAMVSSTDPSHPPLSTLSQAVKTKARMMILAAVMLLEMLVTRGTSQKSSWRTGRLLWRLRKTICEEHVRLVHNMCCKSFSIRAPSTALKHFIDDLSGFWRWALENEGKSQREMAVTTEH